LEKEEDATEEQAREQQKIEEVRREF